MANLLNTQINALTLINECADVIGPLDVAVAEEQGKQIVNLTALVDLMKMRFPATYVKISNNVLHNLLACCGLSVTKKGNQSVLALTYFKSSLLEIQLQIQETVAAQQCQAILNAKEMCIKFKVAAYNNCNRVFNKPQQQIMFYQTPPLHLSEDELLAQIQPNMQTIYQQNGNIAQGPNQQVYTNQNQIYDRFVKFSHYQEPQVIPEPKKQSSTIEE
ncbi:Hypothetical_protein [Hexamita inflata]|uniref:Hypothetical_protein n=1 Tax=Hexamita inflata TaxID=28002 RepID=A0AA86QDJ2_9EUKA|nr:Hypothetical protein HINF_LOCUS37675 [Hexamita inflata]